MEESNKQSFTFESSVLSKINGISNDESSGSNSNFPTGNQLNSGDSSISNSNSKVGENSSSMTNEMSKGDSSVNNRENPGKNKDMSRDKMASESSKPLPNKKLEIKNQDVISKDDGNGNITSEIVSKASTPDQTYLDNKKNEIRSEMMDYAMDAFSNVGQPETGKEQAPQKSVNKPAKTGNGVGNIPALDSKKPTPSYPNPGNLSVNSGPRPSKGPTTNRPNISLPKISFPKMKLR